MFKQFIGCAASNFLVGRKTHRVEAIVLHGMNSLAQADALYRAPTSAVSAHYAVSDDGTVHQYVDDTDTAFHAGIVVNPTWSLLKPGVNPNLYTLGVVCAGTWNDALYTQVRELLQELAARHAVPLDAAHLPVHAEIRASKRCPGEGFDRGKLLTLLARPKAPTVGAPRRVRLLRDANLRDGAPRTDVRIVRTCVAGEVLDVAGWTDAGERVAGNANWYRTADAAYLWAGNTDYPHPIDVQQATVASQPPAFTQVPTAGPPTAAPTDRVPSVTPADVTTSGIARINALLAGGGQTIGRGDTDSEAVGALQDLLAGHGFSDRMPSLTAASYGRFGPTTAKFLGEFQLAQSLPSTGVLDWATLRKLVSEKAATPRMSRAYLTLVLGMPFDGMRKIVAITAQMEGVGKFAAINANTDRAGLSYGIIQWAQKPGRLVEILRAYHATDPGVFVELFGDGDAPLAEGLLEHTGMPKGGVTDQGVTTNARYDLIVEPWPSRFRAAAAHRPYQRAQIEIALAAFRRSLKAILRYAPGIRSERGVAFMLDVANQYGDAGLHGLHDAVHRSDLDEEQLLEAIADLSVARIDDNFKAGVRARRDGFLTTPLLADAPLDVGALLSA